MKTQSDPMRLFHFLAMKVKASESFPLKLGNVEFWHPVPGFPVDLCYSIPVTQWDVKAIQNDANRIAAPIWGELCAFLDAKEENREQGRSSCRE